MTGRVVNEADKRITQAFGKGHTGVDIGWRQNEEDNKVFAHSAGTVITAVDGKDTTPGSRGLASYGNYVDIDHGNGYVTRYAHLRKGSVRVKKGDKVDKNTLIGIIGESGNVTGRHLHFEVFHNKQRIDPTPYLNEDFKQQVWYQSYDNVYKWNPNVLAGTNEYAGNFGIAIEAIYVDRYRIRVHDKKKNEWLPWVDKRSDYAGNIGNAIDGVQIEGATYRVHLRNGGWLSWVSKVDNSSNGYAGIYGREIDALQIR
ncbi:MAG: M23 family metallopeptidase [Bacilli bacterium]|nr:M23 family metallopeptidase [Bacilli bacterium]